MILPSSRACGVFRAVALSVAAILSILLSGCCRTVKNARAAQKAVKPFGDDHVVQIECNSPDLAGCSLSQLVDFAMTNRPNVCAARLAVKDARLRLLELASEAPALASNRLWYAAHVGLDGGYRADSAAAHHVENMGWDTRGGASAALSLELLLWDWGRYDARAKAQTERVLAAELDLIDIGNGVFNEVAGSYFTMLEKTALCAVALTNEAVYAEHLDRAERRFEAGEVKRIDVLRAKLDLSEAREKTVASSNEINTAWAEFMHALGLKTAQTDWHEIIGMRQDQLSSVIRGFPDSFCSAKDAFDAAMTNSPAMKVRRAELRAASSDVDYAIADLKPSISASMSLRWSDPLCMWGWAVDGMQSVLQGWRRQRAVDRAVAAMEIAASAVETAERDLSRDVELAIAVRDDSREAARTARDSVLRARENLETVERQYEVGDVPLVDYSDSVSDYVTALGNRISAFYRGQRAEAALFAIIGDEPRYREEIVMEEK